MFRTTDQVRVATLAPNAQLSSTLDRDREPNALPRWEDLIAARSRLKVKRRYRLWYRLNKSVD